MKLLVKSPDATASGKVEVWAPIPAPATIWQGDKRLGNWLDQIIGRRRVLNPGQYVVRWGNCEFTLEVK